MHCAFGAPSLRSGRGPPWTPSTPGHFGRGGRRVPPPPGRKLERSGCKLIGVLAARQLGFQLADAQGVGFDAQGVGFARGQKQFLALLVMAQPQ